MRSNMNIQRSEPVSAGHFGARKCVASVVLLLGVIGANHALASPVLWIDDAQNRLGTVDIGTGAVSLVGSMGGDVMTDIAFDPSGNLWGLSFTKTYRINSQTGAATLVGSHGIGGGNALVFGSDGTLYAAGFGTGSLFKINTNTGAGSLLGSAPLLHSAGDLAFYQGQMYLSNTSNQLVKVDTTTPANSSLVGNIGFSSVFGIATADDGNLYGTEGTSVIKINPVTGAGTLVRNYGGGPLGQAYGTSFITEAIPAVPEPSSFALFAIGAMALVFGGRRRANVAATRQEG